MVLPILSLDDLKPVPNINRCICGSDDIAIAESYTLCVQNYAIIKCNKCNREIKRRTYKRAEEAWNENNPKTTKLYEITYETSVYQVRHKTIVTGSDEIQAIENFRNIGSSQKFSDVVSIKLYNVEEGAN